VFQFLIPILIGFSFNTASVFTTRYAHWFGVRGGRLVSIIMRDVLGIPVWVLGYVMAVRASTTMLFDSGFFTTVIGWSSILAGGVLIIAGLTSIKWQAASPSVNDELVTQGVYARIRHPLYSGMFLELVGIFLLFPTLPVMVACGLGVLWVMVQARLEEMDLLERLPAYKEYIQQVPRFLPKVRLH
jgi:protein-S-isoprenylcysteine O-methyltransferase Ste14